MNVVTAQRRPDRWSATRRQNRAALPSSKGALQRCAAQNTASGETSRPTTRDRDRESSAARSTEPPPQKGSSRAAADEVEQRRRAESASS